jgi:hypothetical protein
MSFISLKCNEISLHFREISYENLSINFMLISNPTEILALYVTTQVHCIIAGELKFPQNHCCTTIQRRPIAAFPWQKWLPESAAVLIFTHTAYLVNMQPDLEGGGGRQMCRSSNPSKMCLGVVSISMTAVNYTAYRVFSSLCPEKKVTNL